MKVEATSCACPKCGKDLRLHTSDSREYLNFLMCAACGYERAVGRELAEAAIEKDKEQRRKASRCWHMKRHQMAFEGVAGSAATHRKEP